MCVHIIPGTRYSSTGTVFVSNFLSRLSRTSARYHMLPSVLRELAPHPISTLYSLSYCCRLKAYRHGAMLRWQNTRPCWAGWKERKTWESGALCMQVRVVLRSASKTASKSACLPASPAPHDALSTTLLIRTAALHCCRICAVNVLYSAPDTTSVEHRRTAWEHGWHGLINPFTTAAVVRTSYIYDY